MLKSGKRQLKDITDQELQVIVEMSHHYGCKDLWGNPVITDIDRNMFQNTIVIDYEQTRINDGEKSLTVMFFEYNSLTYHVDYRYPYARSSKSESITEDPKMLLWLLNQDFDLLSILTEKPTAIYMSQSYKTMGFLVGHGHCGYFKMDTMKFFGPDDREKAREYLDERKQEKDYVHIFQVLDVNERDADFRLKDKHYERMEHCIGLDGANVKDDLYKVYRNCVAYTECVAEWEDLVRNGYAKRSGEIGHSIFYSVTRKGLKAVACRILIQRYGHRAPLCREACRRSRRARHQARAADLLGRDTRGGSTARGSTEILAGRLDY